jgi:hypothetical protein
LPYARTNSCVLWYSCLVCASVTCITRATILFKMPNIKYPRRAKQSRKKTAVRARVRIGSVRPGFVLPERMDVALRYSQEVPLHASAGVAVSYVFRANDLYDPDYTGTGHQPLGFDQLCLFYKRFFVTKSTCIMTPVWTTVSNLIPGYYGLAISDDGAKTAGYTISNLCEQALVTKPQIGGITTLNLNHHARAAFSVKKFFGLKGGTLDNDFACSAAASAARVGYYEAFQAPVGGNTVDIQYFLIQLDYHVTCVEPIALAQS